MPSRTNVRFKDLLHLPKYELAMLLWNLVKEADVSAARHTADSPETGGRDVCVLSPNTILEPVEEVTERAWG